MTVTVVEWDCTVAETDRKRWVVRDIEQPEADYEGFVVGRAAPAVRITATRLARWLNWREGLEPTP